jgi:AraC family transcriptional regulator of adaptative response/methylated-DNA-[protein]-cysteine methyltransferase
MMEDKLTQQANDYQRIEEALHFLETSFPERPSLEEIAASVHLSKYHFQRLFKRWAGISPTQFLQYLTVEYAKERLLESQSVLGATLDAGLSSPGRLHDLFVTFEAVTPGEYKGRGAGLQITYGLHDTPFGKCLVAATSRGICGLQFLTEDDLEGALEPLMEQWPKAEFTQDKSSTQPLVDRIFAPAPASSARPFHLQVRGTNFQVNVWRALLAIPPGAMVSYQAVAAYMGNPKAAQAVANAVARNPIAYLIPCHRVITKVGQMHNYRWGATRKKAMLGWEASRRHQELRA